MFYIATAALIGVIIMGLILIATSRQRKRNDIKHRMESKIEELKSNGYFYYCNNLSPEALISELGVCKSRLDLLLKSDSDSDLFNNDEADTCFVKSFIVEGVMRVKGIPDWQIDKIRTSL